MWLRKYRKTKGLSQKEVAEKANITHQFYNYIENGLRRPSYEVAKKIASILDFDWTLFFEVNENASQPHNKRR